ncbi:MAG: DUF5606 domain-containing protein [Bacteroidetes bacterium]|nr:DUF5606 domain-containing protein [Fibrella sp.]
MEALKQIANIAGHSGLYRIIKPSRSGVIVESLDDKKEKTMMGATARVSVLNDISIYVDTADGSVPLGDVLRAIDAKYGETLMVDPKGSNTELADFMATVVPDYDRDRVRASDIKKLVVWYGILRKNAPELFAAPVTPEGEPTGEAAIAEATEQPEAVVANPEENSSPEPK